MSLDSKALEIITAARLRFNELAQNLDTASMPEPEKLSKLLGDAETSWNNNRATAFFALTEFEQKSKPITGAADIAETMMQALAKLGYHPTPHPLA